MCKTEAKVKEAWFTGDPRYGTRVLGDMIIDTIILCYSVIAPLIIPFGVVYFGLGWLILRNQVMLLHSFICHHCWLYHWNLVQIRINAFLNKKKSVEKLKDNLIGRKVVAQHRKTIQN